MVSAISSLSGFQSTALQLLQDKYAKTDTDSNGSVSLEEFQAGVPENISGIEELFSNLDANSDGSLSEDEFISALAQNRPPPPQNNLSGDVTQRLAELFGETDQNGDGSLSLEEFQAGAPADTPDNQEELFANIDSNGDGSLSEEEFTVALTGGGGPGATGGPPPGGPPPGGGGGTDEDEESGISYDPLDTNGDGVVSIDELLAAAQSEEDDASTGTSALESAIDEFLQALDSDEDGTLSTEEARNGFNALRQATLDYLISLQEQTT